MTSIAPQPIIDPAGNTSRDPMAALGRAYPGNIVRPREGNTPDDQDGKRLNMLRVGWAAFDDLVRGQNRQIEENVRMLAGQQHSVFHPVFNKWLDVTEWMTAEERAYRTRAVFNRLFPWFIVTHARMTENTPIITYLPGPDRADAELAELLDIAGKSVWFEANMEDVHDRLMGWVAVAGRGHLLSRINPHKGQKRQWIGEADLPVVDAYDQPVMDEYGGQMSMPMFQGVPFNQQGEAQAKWRMTAPGQGEMVQTGEPYEETVGAIEVQVLSPMQVRGSWGPDPWHQKRVHWIKSFHAPEELFDAWQVDVPPDVRGGNVSDVGEMERLLFGSGFYGAVSGLIDPQLSNTTSTEGYVEVTQRWEAPSSYFPKGRWTVASRTKVLYDGDRPAQFPYTSPMNTFEFVRVPGRPGGSTPQETLNPVQREWNAENGRIADHTKLLTNPKALIDAASGIQRGKWTNKPGENHYVNRRGTTPVVEYVTPPPLGTDVYKRLELLLREFHDLGFMAGANDPGTPGDSGEKVKEVRFNTDRFLGPTMRRAAGEYGRMYETWGCLYPLVWDMETTLHYMGDDNVARTITVYPELFKQGKCNTRPDVESMLPEGRGEKQEKAFALYQQGMFGLPGTPQALRKFWEVAHMPHLARFAKPGGIDATTAEQENGQLLQGMDPTQIPVYEWYDHQAHLMVHEQFMKSPEYKKLAPPIQDAFAFHRQAHQQAAEQALVKAAMQQSALQNALAPPTPPGNGPGGGGAPGGTPGGAPGGGPPPEETGLSKKGPPNPSVRPTPPEAPRGQIPGGTVPTAVGAPPPASLQHGH